MDQIAPIPAESAEIWAVGGPTSITSLTEVD